MCGCDLFLKPANLNDESEKQSSSRVRHPTKACRTLPEFMSRGCVGRESASLLCLLRSSRGIEGSSLAETLCTATGLGTEVLVIPLLKFSGSMTSHFNSVFGPAEPAVYFLQHASTCVCLSIESITGFSAVITGPLISQHELGRYVLFAIVSQIGNGCKARTDSLLFHCRPHKQLHHTISVLVLAENRELAANGTTLRDIYHQNITRPRPMCIRATSAERERERVSLVHSASIGL